MLRINFLSIIFYLIIFSPHHFINYSGVGLNNLSPQKYVNGYLPIHLKNPCRKIR
jgi:hypothetical protein